jgi:hypothetical protein
MSKNKRAADEYVLTPPVSETQSNAIMRIADAHRNMIDLLDAELPSGDLRDRVLASQQDSFILSRLLIENSPKSFPEPKVKVIDADDLDEPDFGDTGADESNDEPEAAE